MLASDRWCDLSWKHKAKNVMRHSVEAIASQHTWKPKSFAQWRLQSDKALVSQERRLSNIPVIHIISQTAQIIQTFVFPSDENILYLSFKRKILVEKFKLNFCLFFQRFPFDFVAFWQINCILLCVKIGHLIFFFSTA